MHETIIVELFVHRHGPRYERTSHRELQLRVEMLLENSLSGFDPSHEDKLLLILIPVSSTKFLTSPSLTVKDT
jgi:hypothetical protein